MFFLITVSVNTSKLILLNVNKSSHLNLLVVDILSLFNLIFKREKKDKLVINLYLKKISLYV